MKIESQKKQEHVFFLATENLVLHVNEPFRIRLDMIEMKNFVPEAFIMHHFQESKYEAIPYCNYLKLSKGEMLMSALDPEASEGSGWFSKVESPFSPDRIPQRLKDDEDEEDEDWDDEDEDWDDEDEDWDEEDEDWDDEDEDWDDEDEDKDKDTEGGEEDWSEETES